MNTKGKNALSTCDSSEWYPEEISTQPCLSVEDSCQSCRKRNRN